MDKIFALSQKVGISTMGDLSRFIQRCNLKNPKERDVIEALEREVNKGGIER